MRDRHAECLRSERLRTLPRAAVVTAVVAMLALSGCTSSPPTPAGTSATPGTSATSSSPAMPASTSPTPAALPSKVFTDQELTAIGAAMLQQRGQRPEFMYDSQQLRTAFKSHPYPLTRATAQPMECGALHLPAMDDALQDPSMNFASGPVPIAGESGPTTTILFTIRSAPREKLAKADFDYTDDLISRCGQFEVSYEPQGSSSSYMNRLLKPPLVGEKAYAVMSSSAPYGSVGLRVLAGTLSISMVLGVSPLNSEADAQPALDSMASVAQQLIDEAALNPPSVSPLPPNAKTPEQLTDLLQGITGPNGATAAMASGTVLGAVSGASPASPTAPPSLPDCTFSDGAYFSSLLGSTTARAEILGSVKMDYLTVRLISMPATATTPYPFDVRAAALRDCPTIQEEVFTGPGTSGSLSPWTSLHRLSLNVPADSAYAVAHEHPDGAVWHLLAGARKGSLTVELEAIKNTEAGLQPGADDMAAVINQVFAKAGQ